jgi:SAM-dependent methyltransferase
MDAAAWDERYRSAELLWRVGPNRFAERELADLPPGRAVDLAAGEGRHAVWLARLGWQVDAVDFSSVALARAERLAAEQPAAERGTAVRTVRCDVTAWRGAADAYDLALICYLHIPWPELAGVLRRAAEAVRTGGTLLLVGHAADNLRHGHGGPRDPAVLHAPEQIADEWRRYARVIRADTCARPVETDDGRRTALDTVVRAERR